MHLYNLTLQRATGITCAVHGNFSGAKLQEVIVSRGKILELLRHDPNTGKIYPVLTQEVFGVIRALIPFRLTGGTKGRYLMLYLTAEMDLCIRKPTIWVCDQVRHKSGCTATEAG